MVDINPAIALGIKPFQVDVATPLMEAAKLRAAQAQEQQTQIAMQKQAAGDFARGVAVYADKPEFAQKWAEGMDQLHANGMIPDQQYQAMRNNPSPLVLNSIIAQTTTPEQALARDQFAESTRHNKATEGQAAALLAETKRQHDYEEGKPVIVPAGASLVERGSGREIFKGANGLTDAATEVTARQILNGDLSGLTNIGRGAQGDAKLTAIKNKAADILINENGMTPAEAAGYLSTKLQAFKASSVGATTEARTTAGREANLNLILKATDAAIPAALEASEKVARTGWVPINQIIQKGEVTASNPELKRFGMANLQLAEHWARAMNPTGVMRESDRDMALKFLSTADSKETYRQVLEQLKTQITRERDAVRSQSAVSPAAIAPAEHPATAAPAPAATPGAIPPPPAGFQIIK